MHEARAFPVHFPLRRLHRDAATGDLLAPERRQPVGLHHLLYRCYDDGQRPLYIGLTSCSGVRLDTHRRQSEWWPLAEYIAVSAYVSRDDLKEGERAALRHERPRFNKVAVRGPANVKLPLYEGAELAAAALFREAMPEFITELAALLSRPECFPQPSPPPPPRLAGDAS